METAKEILAKRVAKFPAYGSMNDENIRRNVLASMEEYATKKSIEVLKEVNGNLNKLPAIMEVVLKAKNYSMNIVNDKIEELTKQLNPHKP